MPKIKFIATEGFRFYHDAPDFNDGDIREVDERQYKKLLEDFPKNFFAVETPKAFDPWKNKMINGKSNK